MRLENGSTAKFYAIRRESGYEIVEPSFKPATTLNEAIKPVEYIAEFFARAISDKKLNNEAWKLYKELGGPEIITATE